MNEKDKIIKFLKEDPETFITTISLNFPLSDEFTEKYRDLLKWSSLLNNNFIKIDFEFCKKFRKNIEWVFFEPWSSDEEYPNMKSDLADTRFLEEFKDELNWSQLSNKGSNELLSDENIERFIEYINFRRLSGNHNKIFSEELIQKYEDKWDWLFLSGSDHLPVNINFFRKYEARWYWDILMQNTEIQWPPEILNMAKHHLSAYEFEELRDNRLNFTDDDDDEDDPVNLTGQKTVPYTPEEFASILNNVNPAQLSKDKRVPWTISLIDFYKDEWDWKELSCNESLPWSEELIDRYFDYWYWGDRMPRKNGIDDDSDDLVIIFGLSENKGIHWTDSMIRKYRDYLIWHFFAYNESIEWNADLLIEHKKWLKNIDIANLNKLWEKVFLPNLDEETIGGIFEAKRQEISEIIRKRKKDLLKWESELESF